MTHWDFDALIFRAREDYNGPRWLWIVTLPIVILIWGVGGLLSLAVPLAIVAIALHLVFGWSL